MASPSHIKFLKSIAHHIVSDILILEDKDEAAQIAWATTAVEAALGNFQDSNKVLGTFMDFKVAQGLEKEVISHIVTWAWLKARSELEAAAKDTAPDTSAPAAPEAAPTPVADAPAPPTEPTAEPAAEPAAEPVPAPEHE